MNTPINTSTSKVSHVNGIANAAHTVVSSIKTAIKNRIQEQKNFENRSDNSNYYGSAKSYK